jgi:hypothetical protein
MHQAEVVRILVVQTLLGLHNQQLKAVVARADLTVAEEVGLIEAEVGVVEVRSEIQLGRQIQEDPPSSGWGAFPVRRR